MPAPPKDTAQGSAAQGDRPRQRRPIHYNNTLQQYTTTIHYNNTLQQYTACVQGSRHTRQPPKTDRPSKRRPRRPPKSAPSKETAQVSAAQGSAAQPDRPRQRRPRRPPTHTHPPTLHTSKRQQHYQKNADTSFKQHAMYGRHMQTPITNPRCTATRQLGGRLGGRLGSRLGGRLGKLGPRQTAQVRSRGGWAIQGNR
jgi:hypothetical protein